jgi:hypothetical protein
VKVVPRTLVVVVVAALAACGPRAEEAPAEGPADDPSSGATPGGLEAADHGRASDPPPARFGRVEGTVTMAGAVASRAEPVEAEAPIEVPEGGVADLLLRDGGRITLVDGAAARMTDEGGAQLLLLEGGAHLLQPPAGNSPRPPLRVATPFGTAEIPVSGQAYVHVFPNGTGWLAALAGTVAVSQGDATARRELRDLDLGAGRALAVTDRMAEPTEGPRRLADARAAVGALRSGLVDGAALADGVRDQTRRLDASLDWLEGETRRGRELTTLHRTAVREGSEEAQQLQARLVEHSRKLYRLRRIATVRWERLRAMVLHRDRASETAGSDPVGERRERVAGLLAL